MDQNDNSSRARHADHQKTGAGAQSREARQMPIALKVKFNGKAVWAEFIGPSLEGDKPDGHVLVYIDDQFVTLPSSAIEDELLPEVK